MSYSQILRLWSSAAVSRREWIQRAAAVELRRESLGARSPGARVSHDNDRIHLDPTSHQPPHSPSNESTKRLKQLNMSAGSLIGHLGLHRHQGSVQILSDWFHASLEIRSSQLRPLVCTSGQARDFTKRALHSSFLPVHLILAKISLGDHGCGCSVVTQAPPLDEGGVGNGGDAL